MTPGQVLLHYRLVEQIGEGGMGVVWKAVDTTLDREVAVKILPQVLAGDPERLARFEREAKVLASLNHPNVATVHGFHDAGGIRFLVMELVPGETLEQRLKRGAMPPDEAIPVARKIVDGVEYAHERGIVHRDLKPANIKLTGDGGVKVLDFGLAKAIAGDPMSSGPTSTPTVIPTLTSMGTVAGDDPRHRGLHVSRAGARREHRSSRRRLGIRSRLLRDAHGEARVRRRNRLRHVGLGSARAGGMGVAAEGYSAGRRASAQALSRTRYQETPSRYRRSADRPGQPGPR
jgi:serine/threonine protein kinase